jgi:hypothetical protein
MTELYSTQWIEQNIKNPKYNIDHFNNGKNDDNYNVMLCLWEMTEVMIVHYRSMDFTCLTTRNQTIPVNLNFVDGFMFDSFCLLDNQNVKNLELSDFSKIVDKILRPYKLQDMLKLVCSFLQTPLCKISILVNGSPIFRQPIYKFPYTDFHKELICKHSWYFSNIKVKVIFKKEGFYSKLNMSCVLSTPDQPVWNTFMKADNNIYVMKEYGKTLDHGVSYGCGIMCTSTKENIDENKYF